jgi:hypothetical protein
MRRTDGGGRFSEDGASDRRTLFPTSNWPLVEKGQALSTQDQVSVIFGCGAAVSRKSVLPVAKEMIGHSNVLFSRKWATGV